MDPINKMRDFIFLKSLNLSWVEIHLDTKRWLAVSCRSNRGRWCGWFLVNWFDDWSIGWPVIPGATSAFINKSEFWLVAFRGVLGSLVLDPADSGRLLLKLRLTCDESDAPDDDFRSDESGCSTISRKRASEVDDCDPKYISILWSLSVKPSWNWSKADKRVQRTLEQDSNGTIYFVYVHSKC